MSVWPATVTLAVEPRALRAAVGALEGTAESTPATADQIRALIDTLKRTADFAGLRLTTRELRALRDLASDHQRLEADRDLLERFLLAGEANAPRMPDDVVAGIIESRVTDVQLHRALAERITTRAATRGPRWYRDHGSLYRNSTTFVARLAGSLKGSAPLHQIAAKAELRRGSRLYKDLMQAIIDGSIPSDRARARDSWYLFATDVSDPIDLRVRAFTMIFRDLQSVSPRPDFREGSDATRWVKTSQTVCGGWPRDKAAIWALLPAEAKRWAEIYLTLQAIEQFFDRTSGNVDRKEYWRLRSSQISDFHEFSTARAFMMRLGNRFMIEFLDTGNACYSYDETQWAQLVAKKHQHPSSLKLSNMRGTEHWLGHSLNWQDKFDDYLERYARVPRPR